MLIVLRAVECLLSEGPVAPLPVDRPLLTAAYFTLLILVNARLFLVLLRWVVSRWPLRPLRRRLLRERMDVRLLVHEIVLQ